jgi:hypothetical protein
LLARLGQTGSYELRALADSGCVSGTLVGEVLSIEPTRHGNEVSLAHA